MLLYTLRNVSPETRLLYNTDDESKVAFVLPSYFTDAVIPDTVKAFAVILAVTSAWLVIE